MIEVALENYPLECELPNNLEIMVRPMDPSDEVAFHEFIVAVPEVERLFIKQRITDQAVFHQWCSELDFHSNLPLLAFTRGKLVADGTLHQRQGGWKRHIGLVSVLIHPNYRELGIVNVMIRELVEISLHCGLIKLEAEFSGEQASNIKTFANVGFSELVRLPKYVQDIRGNNHDYVLMGLELRLPDYLTSAGD